MEAQPIGGALLTVPTDAAGEAPVGSGPRSPLRILFLTLCICSGTLLHAEELAAAAAEHLRPSIVVCVVISITALFNLAIFSLNLLVARRRAAGARGLSRQLLRLGAAAAVPASKSLLGLCLAMGAALHAKSLNATAAEYQIDPAVVVCVVFSVTVFFNLSIFKLNFLVARGRAVDAGGPRQLLPPTPRVGAAPALPASKSLLAPFIGLCLAMEAALHAKSLTAAAAEYQIDPAIVVCVVFSVTVFFNLAIFSLNFVVARRGRAAGAGGPRQQQQLLLRPTARSGAPAAPSASKSLLAPFIGLGLAMGAALHAESLVAAAAKHEIDPAVVVCVALAGVALFHLAVLSIHKTLASHGGQDGPKQRPRPRSRGLPLLPFVVLALAISAVSSVETVMADGATPPDLPQDTSVWAALALAVSFNVAIGSLYCFIVAGPPPPPAATVEPRSHIKSAGAMVSCIAAAGIVSFLLLASGGGSGAIAARS